LDGQGCLRSLAFPEMNDRRNDIVPPADGNCTWLLEHRTYKNWASERRGLLWIKGKPGAGKSTLLKYSLRTIPTMEPPSWKSSTISFFFHGRGAEIQKTAVGLYRSLLYQLLERFPNAVSNVVRTFESRCAGIGSPGEKWKWHVQELRDFVESSLATILEESAIRIFVDALDECGEEEARRLVRGFEHLYSRCASAPHGLSICFSCRHWPVIAPVNCLEICAEHENHKDIRTYIQEELQSVDLNPEERKSLQNSIETRSEWVFQWVVLVLRRIIGMCGDGKTLRQCLEALQELPQDLDDLYETIIQSLKRRDQGQSLKLLQWLCFALRPLSITEFRCVMNLDANLTYQSFQKCKKLPAYIETDTQMERQLLSLSGGLAEWKNHQYKRVAQLVHQSVNDYLISKGFYHFDISLVSINRSVGCSHVRLSQSCIVYFTMDEIKNRHDDLTIENQRLTSWEEDTRKNLSKEYPFLEYAVHSWMLHAQVAEEQEMTQSDIFQYLQRHSAWTMELWVGLCNLVRTMGTPNTPTGTTVLHVASQFNLISLVSAIFNNRKQYNVNAASKDAQGKTPLSLAARNGCEAVLKLLLAHFDVDINSRDLSGNTALSFAAENGYEAVIKLLLAQPNVEADSKNKKGWTSLSLTAWRGHEGVVKLLLAQPNVDINSEDQKGCTPLAWAAFRGCEGVIKLLLAQSDVDINSRDLSGNTALSFAAEIGYEAVIKLLLAQPNVNADSKDEWGQTSLSLAAWRGHEGVVKLLLAQPNVDINSEDQKGHTPLAWAAERGHEVVVKLLLASPDINADLKDETGRTPLSYAAERGHETVIKLLLAQSDVDGDLKNRGGWTPLSLAAQNGHEAAVKLLLAHPNVDINSENRGGRTPMSVAARNGHEGAVQLLKSRGARSQQPIPHQIPDRSARRTR